MFMEPEKKITVFDVAKAAGVSKGTVDRVLHNRGEVSRKSAMKVRKAIEDLGYQRNVYASLLAVKRPFCIVCLLPKSNRGEYWHLIGTGIDAGRKYASNFNVRVETVFYDQYRASSFREACGKVISMNPEGVVLPPLFKDDVLAFCGELRRLNIPYSFVDTKVDDEGYLTYFGMPMRQSGKLAAVLLTERCAPDDIDSALIVRILRDKESLADPTRDRREGFLHYMRENCPGCRVDSILINPTDSSGTERILDSYFSSHPGQRFVVMFNSRIHLIAPYLHAHPLEGRRVVGFDTLDGNLTALRNGSVDILISQHAARQSEYAIISLVDSIVLGQAPAVRDNFMHMDIITRYNIG